jgi:hypothetical protein
MSGREILAGVALCALVGCIGRPLSNRGDRGSDTGGSNGWVSVGGQGSGGVGAGGAAGGAGKPQTDGGNPSACRVSDPQYPDAAIGPEEIDIAWCDAAHTCATCSWRFPGVGIFIGAKPATNCALPTFACPASTGGPTSDGGEPSCPMSLNGAAYDQGALIFNDDGRSLYECQVWGAEDAAGGDLTSCQIGGFVCATSCAACP